MTTWIAASDDLMRQHWRSFRDYVTEQHLALVAVVDAVAAYPQLLSLFPFTSVGRLCFSRCTDFPYDVDLLISHWQSTYFAEITLDAGGWVHTKRIGQGSAAEATAIVASLVPEKYGPALVGNADGLPESPIRAARSYSEVCIERLRRS